MHQTLKKLKNLVVHKETSQQSTVALFKRLHLEPIPSQHTFPKKEIAERAFFIWQERGCGHGNDREDWLLAKLQLEDELN